MLNFNQKIAYTDKEKFDRTLVLFMKPCYEFLEHDKDFRNIHYIQRIKFLNNYRKNPEYIQKVVDITKQSKDVLHKDAINCLLYIRDMVSKELKTEIETKGTRNEEAPYEEFLERTLKVLNDKLNEKYENDIFF